MSMRVIVLALAAMLSNLSFAAPPAGDAAVRTEPPLLSGLLRQHGAAMLLVEPVSGRIVDANEAALRFYGYSRSVLEGMSLDQINALSPDEVASERGLALEQKRNYFIFPHRLADGSIRTVEVYSSPIEWAGRSLLLSIVLDMSGKKVADSEVRAYRDRLQELVDSRTRELDSTYQEAQQNLMAMVIFQAVIILLLVVTLFYRRQVQKAELKERQVINAMLDSSLQFMGLLDLEGRLLHANRTALNSVGHSAVDVLGKVFWDTDWWSHSADERARLKRAILLAASGEETRLESVYHLTDGGALTVDFSARPVMDIRGKVVNILVEGRDISARKQAEAQVVARRRELQDANNYLKTLISALPDTLMELDGDGRVYQYHSPSPGFPRSDDGPEGWGIHDFLPSDVCRVILASMAEAAVKGRSAGAVFNLADDGGAMINYELSVTALPESEGFGRRFVVLARALRERIPG